MSDRQAVIERIAKLLALAIDQQGTPEGRLAQQKAERLMHQHGIAQDDVEAHQENMTGRVVVVERSTWRRIIANAVAEYFKIVCFVQASAQMVDGHWRTGTTVFAGPELDLELATYLLDSLINQCNCDARSEADIADRTGRPMDRRALGRYRKSWAVGAREKILRLIQEREQAKAGTALVLSRQGNIKGWLSRNYGVNLKSKKTSSFEVDDAGLSAGRDASLAEGVAGKQQLRLGE